MTNPAILNPKDTDNSLVTYLLGEYSNLEAVWHWSVKVNEDYQCAVFSGVSPKEWSTVVETLYIEKRDHPDATDLDAVRAAADELNRMTRAIRTSHNPRTQTLGREFSEHYRQSFFTTFYIYDPIGIKDLQDKGYMCDRNERLPVAIANTLLLPTETVRVARPDVIQVLYIDGHITIEPDYEPGVDLYWLPNRAVGIDRDGETICSSARIADEDPRVLMMLDYKQLKWHGVESILKGVRAALHKEHARLEQSLIKGAPTLIANITKEWRRNP